MENNAVIPEEQNAGLPEVKQRRILSRTQKLKIFFACMVAWPVLHFCVYYIYINISSIAMAFTTYKKVGVSTIVKSFAGFENFRLVFEFFKYEGNSAMIFNALKFAVLNYAVGMTASLLFAYYVYKKFLFSSFFRVILYMPNLIAQILMVTLFEYITEDFVLDVFKLEQGLLQNSNTRLGTVIFFNLWLGLASHILMYTGAMSGINEAIVESAQLDGITPAREFISITLPMIFPTFITFTVTTIAGMATNQMALFTFYEKSAPKDTATLGYFMYIMTLSASVYTEFDPSKLHAPYSVITAMGLMSTIVVLPTVMIVKKLLEKYGPSTN